jgi:hypothetical protein
MAIDLHVRFGVCEDEPREIHTFTFATEGERKAFIDGMFQLSVYSSGEYSIAMSADEPDPDFEYDEDEEN